MTTNALVQRSFCLDDRVARLGFEYGPKWNGWCVVVGFTRAVAEQIAETWVGQRDERAHWEGDVLVLDGDYYDDDDEPVAARVAPVVLTTEYGDLPLYIFDGWCWWACNEGS